MQELSIRSHARTQMIDITGDVQRALEKERAEGRMCAVFVPHTTAAVTINENADPSVAADLLAQLDKVVPLDGAYTHGEGNSSAHIKASLIGPSVSVPVENGRLRLGAWQGIFFCEFDGPRQRRIWLQMW